jgi:phage/plasmid-associated DNA primase
LIKSIYDKVIVKEYVDRRIVARFNKERMGTSFRGIKRYDHIPYDTELDLVIDYGNAYNRNHKCFVSTHSLPIHGCGRINARKSLSLAVMHRPTRHSFATERYVDLDMCNCQPVLICEILKQHGQSYSALSTYADNYKTLREDIMKHHNVPKDVAKQLPIRLLFGGTYDAWMQEFNVVQGEKMPLFVELENQIMHFADWVWKENQDTIYKACKKTKEAKKDWATVAQAKRGVLGLWSQTVERYVQETAIQWLVDNKRIPLDTIIPCQDGCMVLKEHFYEGITDDMSRAIFDKYGLSVRWSRKEFDEAKVIEPYEGISRTFEEWVDYISPAVISQTFFELYPGNVATESGIFYVFWRGRWYHSERAEGKMMMYMVEEMYSYLRGLIEDDSLLKEKDVVELLAKLRINTSSASHINTFTKLVKEYAPELKDTFNKIRYLIGFENGCYDLRTQEFRPYRFDDYMTTTTGRDFVEIDYDDPENARKRDELILIIEDIMPDPEQRTLLLQVMATALDGYEYGKLHLFTGKGGNGKGLLNNLIRIAIGDYFYQAPVCLLRDLQKTAASSPELYACMNKRWICFTEVKDSISEGVIKTLTGGGEFNARPLYGQPTSFMMKATFCMEFNNPPDLDGKATQGEARRLCQHTFATNYADPQMFPEKIGKTINGIRWKEANPYYGTQQFYIDMRDVFFDLLCGVWNHYQRDGIMHFDIPETVKEASAQFITDQNVFKRAFEEKYQIVSYEPNMTQKDKRDISVSYKEIWEYISSTDHYKTLKKSQKRLYSRDACHEWLEETFGEHCWAYKSLKVVAGISLKYNDYEEQFEEGEEP